MITKITTNFPESGPPELAIAGYDHGFALASRGVPFSKIYYIQQATHKIDANGYRTRFKVKETGL